MKPKELRKKLALKKQTITNLEAKQQDAIRGGRSDRTVCPVSNHPICSNYESCCGDSNDVCSC